VLCAATVKQFKVDGRTVTCGTEEFERLQKGPGLFRSAVNIDLGLYVVEVSADRLLHLQILDGDRRTINNQTFWLYARPGETRSCIGCHETPDTAQLSNRFPAAATVRPVKCLPTGGEFSYRAKAWLKGTLPDECEERARTVRAVNLIGRQ